MHAATRVFDAGDLATGVGLAMLGREELGRSRILLKFGRQAHAGHAVVLRELKKVLNEHEEKQRFGALSAVLRTAPGSVLHTAMELGYADRPLSNEQRAAKAIVDEAWDAVRSQQPERRHRDRMKALCLNLADDGKTWLRPADFEVGQARESLIDAVNDYSIATMRWSDDMLGDKALERNSPELVIVRTYKPAGVVLLPAVWPSFE